MHGTHATMTLYCQCGYPIRVVARWDGDTYHLRLYDGEHTTDGKDGKNSEPLTQCPHCGQPLQPGNLALLPPLSPLRWPVAYNDQHGS